MKEIRIGKFKVEDVGNGVKFTSLSGLEVFVEDKEGDKEDPRQNTLLRLAMGDIDGEDAKKLAEFLEKNNKNNILKYLVNNRPCIFMEERPFKKTPEKDMGPLEKEILMQRKWYKRFFIKKGELTKNEIKKIELLGALKFEEAKKHIHKSPLKIAIDLGRDGKITQMIEGKFVLKKSELKDLTKELIRVSSHSAQKKSMVKKIPEALSKEDLETLASLRKFVLENKVSRDAIEIAGKSGEIKNSLGGFSPTNGR